MPGDFSPDRFLPPSNEPRTVRREERDNLTNFSGGTIEP